MNGDTTEHDKRVAEQKKKFGAGNDFPEGKLNEEYLGELRLLIGAQDGRVIMDFGKSISWFGMTPEGAIEFANGVIRMAEEAAKQNKLDG